MGRWGEPGLRRSKPGGHRGEPGTRVASEEPTGLPPSRCRRGGSARRGRGRGQGPWTTLAAMPCSTLRVLIHLEPLLRCLGERQGRETDRSGRQVLISVQILSPERAAWRRHLPDSFSEEARVKVTSTPGWALRLRHVQLAVAAQWGHVVASFPSRGCQSLKYGCQGKILYQDAGSRQLASR